MTAARLRLASVLVVVARWSTDLDVIFISGVRRTGMIEDEFSRKKNYDINGLLDLVVQ